MRMLVLVTGQTIPNLAARRGDYPAWIREKTGDAWAGAWDTHDVRTAGALPGPRDADAFVITGSSSSVTERADWMLRSEALIRDIASAGTPLLGICFGHQLIAQALGGQVEKNPRGREMGTMPVDRVVDDPLFAGLPGHFPIHGTHVDAVTRLPPEAVLLATTPRDPHAAFRVGGATWGLQFHPEFDADVMRGYLAERAAVVRAEGLDPDAMQSAVSEHTGGETILRNFARFASRASVASSPGVRTRDVTP